MVGLFYCADILIKRFKTRDIREMGGYAKVAPKFAAFIYDYPSWFYGSSINQWFWENLSC